LWWQVTSGKWQQLERIFRKAITLEGAVRESFLQTACDGDPELYADACRLLEAHDRAGDFLSQPAVSVAVQTNAQPLFEAGQIIAGRFRIVRFIAAGGIGEVYEAEDLSLGLRVALKAIRPGAGRSDLLKQELLAARRVTHPNVCRIYDVAEHAHGQTTVLTMELLPGPTLAQELREHGPYSMRKALPLIRQIAGALQAAHDSGVIHRDLKLSNIILAGESGRPMITDFGLALPADARAGRADVGGGTPGYMAPEQFAGGRITPATDIYALGVMISKMIGDIRQPRSWSKVLRRCLEPDPAGRYQRPSDVAAALERGVAWRRAAWIALSVSMLAAISWVPMSRPSFLRWVSAKMAGNQFVAGANPFGVAFDGANIWVTNNGSNTVTKLRASDGACVGTCTFRVTGFAASANPLRVAFDGANIWVVFSSGFGVTNGVTKLRASDGTTLGTYSAGGYPVDVAFDGDNIWVTDAIQGVVRKLRTSDGINVGTFRVGSWPVGLAFDGTSMWVANQASNSLTKLRASDGVNLGTFPAGLTPSDITFDGANIWVPNVDANTVSKIRVSDGVKLGTFATGDGPESASFDGVNVWIVNSKGNSVTKLRASDGFNLGTIRVGRRPRGIAFDGAHFWVANWDSGTASKL
jgi:hypothetical protein